MQKAGGWEMSSGWTFKRYDLKKDIMKSLIDFSSNALFSWGVAEDIKNSTEHVLEVL